MQCAVPIRNVVSVCVVEGMERRQEGELGKERRIGEMGKVYTTI